MSSTPTAEGGKEGARVLVRVRIEESGRVQWGCARGLGCRARARGLGAVEMRTSKRTNRTTSLRGGVLFAQVKARGEWGLFAFWFFLVYEGKAQAHPTKPCHAMPALPWLGLASRAEASERVEESAVVAFGGVGRWAMLPGIRGWRRVLHPNPFKHALTQGLGQWGHRQGWTGAGAVGRVQGLGTGHRVPGPRLWGCGPTGDVDRGWGRVRGAGAGAPSRAAMGSR